MMFIQEHLRFVHFTGGLWLVMNLLWISAMIIADELYVIYSRSYRISYFMRGLIDSLA